MFCEKCNEKDNPINNVKIKSCQIKEFFFQNIFPSEKLNAIILKKKKLGSTWNNLQKVVKSLMDKNPIKRNFLFKSLVLRHRNVYFSEILNKKNLHIKNS